MIPLTGWAARRFGAKRVYLASIGLFTIGSALCGLAESSTSLILFRVLQGVGGGMIMPISQMIMAEVAGPKRMGRVMGIVVMPAMLAPILGPVVGGLILQNLHWSWIFFVNVPIGIVAGILGWRMLPESDLGEAGKLDWRRPAAAGDQHAADRLRALGDRDQGKLHRADRDLADRRRARCSPPTFGWHALRVERPLLDVRLYANRIFAAASLTTFGLGAALFGAMILVPLYYQQVRGESVIVTGLLVGPQGLGMLLVAPWIARMTDRFGGGRVAFVGVSILTLSSLPLAFIGADTSILFISVAAADPRRRHRPLLHPDHDRRLRLAAHRPALRRDAADERPAAGRRRDRHRGPGRRPAAGERRAPTARPSWPTPSAPPTGGRWGSAPPR